MVTSLLVDTSGSNKETRKNKKEGISPGTTGELAVQQAIAPELAVQWKNDSLVQGLGNSGTPKKKSTLRHNQKAGGGQGVGVSGGGTRSDAQMQR